VRGVNGGEPFGLCLRLEELVGQKELRTRTYGVLSFVRGKRVRRKSQAGWATFGDGKVRRDVPVPGVCVGGTLGVEKRVRRGFGELDESRRGEKRGEEEQCGQSARALATAYRQLRDQVGR